MEDEGYDTLTASDGKTGIARLSERDIPLVLLDVYMPGMTGLEVISYIKATHPNVGVVMISGQADIETAVKATKLGALDFIEKPFQPDRLLVSVRNVLKMVDLATENVRLAKEIKRSRIMVGESPPMKKLWEQIMKAAPSK
ncbi:sigma-54-dependent transcriptional regulator, partial [Candidatus Eisenbacteria bacterium]